MEQSLDDYIASGKVGEVNKTDNNKTNESKFKAERRQEEDMEEDDESFGVWRGPSSTKDYIDLDYMNNGFDAMYQDPELKEAAIRQEEKFINKQPSGCNNSENGNRRFDLREKISGNNIPHAQSNQWRLHKLNVDSNRPPGIPPLISACAPLPMSINRESQTNRQRWGKNKNQRNRNGGGGGYGGNGGGHNNFDFKNNNNNRNGMPNGMQNGRINRVNQRNDAVDVLNKNLRGLLNQNSGCRNSSGATVQNLTIECINETKSCQSRYNQQTAYNPGHQQFGNIFSSAQEQKNGENNNLQVQHVNERNGHDTIRSMFGISDINTEVMPILAGKFLEFIQHGPQITKHKAIYDMKVQKEIHQIQEKPLTYTCPGGVVISSDGAGINNCIISPKCSGISLNNRFA